MVAYLFNIVQTHRQQQRGIGGISIPDGSIDRGDTNRTIGYPVCLCGELLSLRCRAGRAESCSSLLQTRVPLQRFGTRGVHAFLAAGSCGSSRAVKRPVCVHFLQQAVPEALLPNIRCLANDFLPGGSLPLATGRVLSTSLMMLRMIQGFR